MKNIILMTLGSCFFSGCSIMPLPEDVTSVDTHAIVQRIRCETRDAIRQLAFGLIAINHKAIADELSAGRKNFKDLKEKDLDSETWRVIQRYRYAYTTFAFNFNMSNIQHSHNNATLGWLFNRGPLTTSISLDIDVERENEKAFKTGDSWWFMLTDFPPDICAAHPNKGASYSYPITGQLGIIKLIRNFYNLNQSANLTGEGGSPTQTDTLTFTTRVAGKVNPQVELELLTSTTQLASASISAETIREDVHKVIITEALPPARGPSITELRALDASNRQEDLQSLRLRN